MSRLTRMIANGTASYTRLAISAAVGFFTVPVVLRTLGPSDYGIFSVIAGGLSLLWFLNGALTASAERHIAYSLGEGNVEQAGEWFRASLVVHLLLAATLLTTGLSIGNWVVYRLLSVPPGRVIAAVWVYRFTVGAMVCNIVATPYQAALMARESIVALSVIAMGSSMCLLVGVFALRFLKGDLLIWYASMYVLSQVVLLLGPMVFCMRHYPECRQLVGVGLRRNRIMELLSFSGLSLLGNFAGQVRSQGPAILLNRFVGTMANAAYGVALQINGFAANLSGGMLRATSPVIVKFEAVGDRVTMIQVSSLSNKYAFIVLWLAVGPALFTIHYCLQSWLTRVPPGTEIFVLLLLIALLIDQLTAGFMASVQAEGRIALYQAIVMLPMFLSVCAGYFALRLRMPSYSVVLLVVAGAVIAGAGRLGFVCSRLGLKATSWFTDVLRPCALVAGASAVVMAMAVRWVTAGSAQLAALYLLNTATAFFVAWNYGMRTEERGKLQEVAEYCRQGAREYRRSAFVIATRHLAHLRSRLAA